MFRKIKKYILQPVIMATIIAGIFGLINIIIPYFFSKPPAPSPVNETLGDKSPIIQNGNVTYNE